MLTELIGARDRLKRGPSQTPQRRETSDTSGDEIDTSKRRRDILSRKTFRMKKVYDPSELGNFFVTGPTDAANKLGHFCCRVCRRDVSVLTHRHHGTLRHFQGSRHFARDQRLRLYTPVWRVVEFHGNPLSEDEREQQNGKIKKVLSVVRDCEHPFAEYLVAHGAGVVYPQLPVLQKVPRLVDAFKMGGSYGFFEKL